MHSNECCIFIVTQGIVRFLRVFPVPIESDRFERVDREGIIDLSISVTNLEISSRERGTSIFFFFV